MMAMGQEPERPDEVLAEFKQVRETKVCPRCGSDLEADFDSERCSDDEEEWDVEYDILFCPNDQCGGEWAFETGERNRHPIIDMEV